MSLCRRRSHKMDPYQVRGSIMLVIWEWTWHQDAMSGCVQNVINTTVFVRFTVLQKLEYSVSRGMLWASVWEAFGDPGVTFSRF